MNGKQLVLIRHGETAWARAGRHTGRTDIELTDLGRAQADALGSMLAGRTFGAALVSPLQRAAETFRRSAIDIDAISTLDDLQEWDYGDHEGRTTAEIRERWPDWTVWNGPVPRGESVAEVGERADRAIDAALATEGDIAVFAHGHLLRVLAARWLGLDAIAGRHFVLATATVSTLGYERDTPAILGWNEACHLSHLGTADAPLPSTAAGK